MTTKSSDNTTLSGQTGTGNYVGATSPTLVTPALGTPASGTLTNCTGLPVAGGGTGVASLTTYAVICGGTTTTGAVQSIASVGTSGQVLTSNGASALPTMQTLSGKLLNIQFFIANGTYTPTAGMAHCFIQCQGGGGAGGGTPTAGATTAAAASGGGAGGYSQSYVTSATIGASQTVTIGAGGTGVSNGNGNNGGDTSVGTIVIAKGGSGGIAQAASATSGARLGGAGGIAGTGDLMFVGGPGGMGVTQIGNGFVSGSGGNSYFASGANGVQSTQAVGLAATANTGGGGSGSVIGTVTGANQAGGNGGSGVVIIWEFS